METQQDNDEIIKDIFRAVIYTDGSTYHPNGTGIGYAGSSAHGYLYNTKNIGIANKDNPSTSLTTSTKGYGALVPNEHKVVPENYIDAVYFYKSFITNNVAETNAIIFTIDKLLEMDKEIDVIYIKSDSAYAIHIYNELLFTMVKDIDAKKNSDLWFLIKDQVERLNSRNIKLEMLKVPGHAGVHGNEIADMLANYGRYVTEQVIDEDRKDLDREYFHVSPGKKYWKPNNERNPFLTVKSLYFSHDTRGNTPKYIVMDYSTKKELGVATNAALFGMLAIKETHLDNYKDIEHILDSDKQVVKGFFTLSELIMDTYYSPQFNHYYNVFGNGLLQANKYNSGLKVLNQNLTARTFQGLARLTYNRTLELDNSLNNYNKHLANEELSEDVKFVDITDMIYETNDKGKQLCKLGMKDETLVFTTDVFGTPMKIVIALGTELLTRNNLKRLEKTVNSVKVELVRRNKIIQVTTIIDNEDLIGIYTNFYTRNVVMK